MKLSLWTLGVLLSFLALGCTPQEEVSEEASGPPRHVFLITVDTLRADRMSAYGHVRETSPVLDDLAAQGVLFERAIAQWPKTGPSFASIFTGRYPHTTGLTHKAALRLPDAYLTLAEFFSHMGYRTAAVVSNGVLAKRLGWDQGFDEYHQTWSLAPEQSDVPEVYRRWINAPKVNELALPLLERHRETEKLFVWIHYSDPHTPYLLPDGTSNPFLGDAHYTDESEVTLENPRAMALGDERELRFYEASYDANVSVADQHIGLLLGKAEDLGMLEDSLLVFTSDHGESLGEHGYYFGHGRLPHNPGSHVPLIFQRFGEAQGSRVDRVVELVDLYPTLRDLVDPDQEVPGLEGQSLMADLEATSVAEETSDGNLLAFSSAGGGSPLTHYRSVQDEDYKLVYHPARKTRRGELPERYEFYYLREDPEELNDLLADGATPENPEAVSALRRLRRELVGWMDGRTWIRPPKGQIEAESEETLKTLRALGYIQ